MTHEHGERELELAVLEFFDQELEWETVDASRELFPDSYLGREHPGQVVLEQRLGSALERFNPTLPPEVLNEAAEALIRSRPPGNAVANNQEVYKLMRDGARISMVGQDGAKETVTVRYIDWDDPDQNDWLAVRQFDVVGDLYPARTDVLGFVNGIPLVLIELKAPHVDHKRAYDDNLTHYREQIPHLFWYNGLSILSNGGNTKVGSFAAPWDQFSEWNRVSNESEPPSASIETALRGVCDKTRLLDIVENFTLFQESPRGLIKMIGKNHQYLGVNNALQSLRTVDQNRGRLGVFWHTQGSGKSFSMIFFAQKALRKVYGGYTFVIVTDRTDLDDQIYKNFVSTGAVNDPEARAESGAEVKQLLTEDHRYVFTLIHKFRTETGTVFPQLSDRSDIIVMADEAHRTQYDALALNLRNALPNAAYLAFTGTPLIAGEERTKDVFGDYVSVYNFRQSIEDRATVPLYYENRSPEVQLINEDFNRDLEDILEGAELDGGQERRLTSEFGREYHLITHDDRLETIATDLVDHYLNRGHQGKAMVISIDKATAVRMYDKVRMEWERRIEQLRAEVGEATGEHREALEEGLVAMELSDMAVVVSPSQNEIAELAKRGADIVPHRKRMKEEDLDSRFKDDGDPLRIVFVCAMWLTGFDAPATSTIYLDKPMRNHSLMQAIARANRVHGEKRAGEIIDYIGVFRRLQEALAIYGAGSGGGIEEGDLPVASKEEQARELREMLQELEEFVEGYGVNLAEGLNVAGFDWVAWLGDAGDALLADDEAERGFLRRADTAARQWKVVKPHDVATQFQPLMYVIVRLSQKIRMETGSPDVSGVMEDVERILHASLAVTPFAIDKAAVPRVDLSEIDFVALSKLFSSGSKNTGAARLRASLKERLARMIRTNSSRIDYAEKLQETIDKYNAGSLNIEAFFDALRKLAASLDEEETRHLREELSEEELTLFDLLTKPEPTLTKSQEAEVKKIARSLLAKLKQELLVLDWRNRQATRAAVKVAIQDELDRLPEIYDRRLYAEKCSRVFEHVFEAYQGDGRSIYGEVA
jgi:type I restriction enzyme R subunit